MVTYMYSNEEGISVKASEGKYFIRLYPNPLNFDKLNYCS